MSKNLKTILALSFIPQYFLIKYLGRHPDWIERYYSTGFYVYLSRLLRFIFGWIPFAVGDIFYTIAGILIIRFLILNRKMYFSQTRNFFREVFLVISFVYFIFHLFWGMNYYRQPIHKTLDISQDYTTEELYEFTQRLIDKSNDLQLKLTGNDTIMVEIPYSNQTIYKMTTDGYNRLAEEIPGFEYSPKSIKTSLYSTALTYMGYSGYLNPFTNEAQVNGLQIDFKYPTVSCHEEAHQLGYSAENEANFIGYLAAVNNQDLYFQYSGYIYVLRYCLGEIRRRDEEKFNTFNQQIHKGIIKNYIEVAQFWNRHKNVAEPAFKSTFNSFLKANNQADGIKTYSYVVGLLINYYRTKSL